MPVTFAGQIETTASKRRQSSMLLGLPHRLLMAREEPGYYYGGYLNNVAPRFPFAFPLTAIAYLHWRVKSWKVSGTLTYSGVTYTWADAPLVYPGAGYGINHRPDRVVDLCRNTTWYDSVLGDYRSGINFGGQAWDRDIGSATFYMQMFWDQPSKFEELGGEYDGDIYISHDPDTGTRKYFPALFVHATDGIAALVSSLCPEQAAADVVPQAGHCQMLGLSIPLYGWDSCDLTIEPNELYNYPLP